MQSYMLTVLVKQDVDEKKRSALLDAIKKQFDSLKKEDLWGNRGMAYPIKHADKAYYAHWEFSAEQDKIAALDRSIKLNEDVLRYLITKVEERKAKKKVTSKKQVASTEEKAEEVVEDKE